MTKIAILGAGITGVTTASSLLDRGYEVTLLDRNRYAAMQTSFANGGQLSASNAETWTRWSTVFKGLKWMMTRGAPLLVNPKPSWHKYSWMAEFIGSIPQYRANTIETVRMVERVDIGTDGLNVRLRVDGLSGLAREMLAGNMGAAA